MDTPQRSRPLGALLGEIVDDAEALLKDHAELAKAEVKGSLGKAGKASALLGAAAGAAALAVVFLLAALARLINVWTSSEWIGFGVVTLLLLIAAGVLYAIGKARLAAVEKKPLPMTTEAIKEDVAWLSTTLKRT